MGDEHSDRLDLSLRLKVSSSIPPPSPLPPPSPSIKRIRLLDDNNVPFKVAYPTLTSPQLLPTSPSSFKAPGIPLPSTSYTFDSFEPIANPSTMISHRSNHRSRRTGSVLTAETQELVEDTIEPPPFPWATSRPAGIHSLDHLASVGIDSVVGELMCRRCEHRESFSYDLCSKFEEVGRFVIGHGHGMHDRAPPEWMNPVFPDCVSCGQNCMRPVLADRNETINWLFLFLGQTLGVCTLEQLKWFCKHTGNHRTGAKDRVLYLSYIAICMQLQPDGPFDRLINTSDN